MLVLWLLAVLTLSLHHRLAGAPIKSTLATPVDYTSRVWITMDYPSSVKIPTAEDVKQFLYTIQHEGVSECYLDFKLEFEGVCFVF